MPPRMAFLPSNTACLLYIYINKWTSIFICHWPSEFFFYLTKSCSWLFTRQLTTVAPMNKKKILFLILYDPFIFYKRGGTVYNISREEKKRDLALTTSQRNNIGRESRQQKKKRFPSGSVGFFFFSSTFWWNVIYNSAFLMYLYVKIFDAQYF